MGASAALVLVMTGLGLVFFKILSGLVSGDGPLFKMIAVAGSMVFVMALYIPAANGLARASEWSKKQMTAVIGILILSVVMAVLLVKLKKPPVRKAVPESSPLVKTSVVKRENLQMRVEGYGQVSAKRQVEVVPQVSGKVIELSENFINGGFFEAGEVLIRIDPEDYELAVESSEAEVARAQTVLETETAEAKVSRAEWMEVHPNDSDPPALVVREPQIRQAKAALKGAEAKLAAAKLNLERTRISLPFDGRVSEERVDVGQYLTAGGSVATVYGTSACEIVVPLEDKDLEWFTIPQGNSEVESGPAADVWSEFGGSRCKWRGRVVRSEAALDPQSRVVGVVIEVENPFEPSDGCSPLVPNMFVTVDILGKELEDVLKVPRFAVHKGNEVWVVNEGRLDIRQVEIIRQDDEFSLIKSGISDNDVIVTSPLDIVTDGMEVRVDEGEGVRQR
jgi:RND family efflux transporter MFP subunit